MIKFTFIVVGLLGFSGLVLSLNPQAVDGYVFENKEFTNRNIRVTMYYYDSLESLRLEAQIREYSGFEQLLAFAEGDDMYCEIHTVDPKIDYRPERYGHELMHCVHGNWHSDQFIVPYED